MNRNKIIQFEYAIHKLIEWYNQAVVNPEQTIYNHFTRLTSLKLVFLMSAIKDPNNNNRDLLDIFNNYCAMQYGPVEVDIYSAIVYKQTQYFNFGNYELSIIKEADSFEGLTIQEKQQIERAIALLKSCNPQLISLRASQLVNITHKWDAWLSAMGTAEWYGKGSEKMTIESIRNSRPFYE